MGLIFLAIFFALSITNFGSAGFLTNNQNPPLQATANKDCTYKLEDKQIIETYDAGIDASLGQINGQEIRTLSANNQGVVADENDLVNQYKQRYANPSKRWVLVKRDAPIIAYKVTKGADDSDAAREMDILGKIKSALGVSSIDNDKWAFISLGHCRILGSSPSGCWDPVTLITLYVLQKKGTDQNNAYPGIDNDPSIPSNGTGYVPWVFNVYVAEELLLANHSGAGTYTISDLPCWMTQCLGGDLRAEIYRNTQPPPPTPTYPPYDILAWNRSCSSSNLPPRPPPPSKSGLLGESLAPGEDYPPSFVKKEWVDPGAKYANQWGDLPEYAFFVGKLTDPGFIPVPTPSANSIVNYRTFDGKLGPNTVTFEVSIKKLGTAAFGDIGYILKPQTRNVYYLYITAENTNTSTSTSLKLSTFTLKPGFVYEWWYPSCKPVVYLYPEKETSFDVKLKPFGILTESIPSYPWLTGWKNVLAKPNGEITYNGQKYDYLYYEGRSFFVKVPKEGFVIKGFELSDFFDAILPQLGLNEKEITDFKQYWLGRLNEADSFYSVQVLPREEIDRVEPMELSPTPDTFIRLRLFFKKLDKPQLLQLPVLPETPKRRGTTIVDWGGFFK